MERFAKFSLYAQNFKCFGPEPQGLEQVHRLNLIIGRNNTGKSALLDLVRYAIKSFDLGPYAYRHKVQPTISMAQVLDEELIKTSFPANISGEKILGQNRLAYGMRLVGAKMRVSLSSSGSRADEWDLDFDYDEGALLSLNKIANAIKNPFAGLRFAHIAAERDVVAEPDSADLVLDSDGSGATNIIQRVINDEKLPSELVEEVLRAALNRIMGPDANFSRITAQRTAGDRWLIYLDERAKGRISLADSGSGLKTILLVLIRMLVLPQLDGSAASTYVFAFEELENNLHPGLQRRLLKYIQDRLAEVESIAFVTTHAPAVIDMFSRNDDAQILHVVHDGQVARVQKVAGTSDGHAVLNDLDVNASDLLQANGIVWVEGISDVIYLRRWIELFCHDKDIPCPVEGSEYAFMEYGGRCLNHLDFAATCAEDLAAEDAEWLLPVLAISRNTYVFIDSDKRSGTSKLGETKLQAAEAAGGSWITEGREVENYLPADVAEVVFGKTLNKYASAAGLYKACKGSRLDKKKAAMEAVALLTPENWRCRDLEKQIERLVNTISGWNPQYIE